MSLEFVPVTDAELPASTPSLMPFHISYTGPAPISRYFRPKPAPPSLSIRSPSAATLVASSSSTLILSETNSSLATLTSTTSVGRLLQESECGEEDVLSKTRSSIEVVSRVEQVTTTRPLADVMEMDSDTQPLDGSPRLVRPAPRHAERFLAAFRGRQMYGQAVDVPVGYGGLVLRAPLDSKGKAKDHETASSKPLSQKAKPKSKTRAATRRSNRVTVADTADEPEGGIDGDCCPDAGLDSLPPTRKLIPSSTFASFMLWTPDRPLDEGRDEYVRTLVEWTRLATEIHSYDD